MPTMSSDKALKPCWLLFPWLPLGQSSQNMLGKVRHAVATHTSERDTFLRNTYLCTLAKSQAEGSGCNVSCLLEAVFSPSLIMAMAGTNCFTANSNVGLGGHPGSCSMGRCYGNTPSSQSCTKTRLGGQSQPKLHTRNELVQ